MGVAVKGTIYISSSKRFGTAAIAHLGPETCLSPFHQIQTLDWPTTNVRFEPNPAGSCYSDPSKSAV